NEAQTTEVAIAYAREGLRVAPRTTILWDALGGIEQGLGHFEAARENYLRAVAVWKGADRAGYEEVAAKDQVHIRTSVLASLAGDHLTSLRETQAVSAPPGPSGRQQLTLAVS